MDLKKSFPIISRQCDPRDLLLEATPRLVRLHHGQAEPEVPGEPEDCPEPLEEEKAGQDWPNCSVEPPGNTY